MRNNGWERVGLGLALALMSGIVGPFASDARADERWDFERQILKCPRPLSDKGPEAAEPPPRVIAADVLEGGAQEIVWSRRDAQEARFDLARANAEGEYAFDATARFPLPQAAPRFQFTTARLAPDGARRLIAISESGVWALPRSGALEWTRLAIPIPPTATYRADYLELAQDLDGDGRDELILAHADGPRVWRQSDDGWEMLAMPPETPRARAIFSADDLDAPDGKSSTERRLFQAERATPPFAFADFNADGRLDLLRFTDPRAFEFEGARWLQNPPPGDPRPMRVEGHAYDPDLPGYGYDPTLIVETEWRENGRIEWLDIDGDRVPDHVETWSNFEPLTPRASITYRQSRRVSAAGERPLRFRTPDAIDHKFRSRDPMGVFLFPDVDGDGRLDLFFIHFEYSVTSREDMADFVLGKRMKFSLEGRLHGLSGWGDQPDVRERFSVEDYEPGAGFFPWLDLAEDWDGDGAADWAMLRQPDRLEIRRWDRARRAYADRPNATLSPPPSRELLPVDLNADGFLDVLAFDMDDRGLWIFTRQP